MPHDLQPGLEKDIISLGQGHKSFQPGWKEFLSGTLNWLMHNETEGKLTLRLIPTSKVPYTGLVYREDS